MLTESKGLVCNSMDVDILISEGINLSWLFFKMVKRIPLQNPMMAFSLPNSPNETSFTIQDQCLHQKIHG
ncbi:hypothetical protein L2E82_15237 [Cichorium intybus]|uniref:Uncharacterized protein n=1 Tax=Cichorium intybus TaxID=13427 RepID=A0ACB9F1V0_CICIN|nr:hypothetical protein L2E82_15237 [Cichorium intybus]